jgi:mRNA-degrading endonuclease RelE of RelBE toxin-antitoxin system
VARFVETNVGDVKQLRGINPPRYRLRVGDWRIAFRKRGDDAIEIISVRNRKDAYR